MRDLEIVERLVLRQNGFQQPLQLWDVLLVVAEVVNELPDSLLESHLKGTVKGAVGGDDAQVLVQH